MQGKENIKEIKWKEKVKKSKKVDLKLINYFLFATLNLFNSF